MDFKGAFVLFPVILTIILADCVGAPGGAQVKDCGVDMTCFYVAASTCTPAKVITEQSQLALYMETNQISGDCKVYLKVMSAPDTYSSVVGKSMLCPMPGDLFSITEEFINSCSGDLKDALKEYLYPEIPVEEPQEPTADTCSDGSLYGHCSSTKPLYCNNGQTINKCSLCGCPADYTCNTTSNNCYMHTGPAPDACSDGTVYDTCSVTKPLYCDDGNLVNKCSYCGCLNGESCNSIVETMLVGDNITATDYTVRLDSVIMGDTNVYYAVFTVTNASGTSETSIQMANGVSYTFFMNKIKVSVIQVGYNQTIAKGYARVNVSSSELCFSFVPAPSPIVPILTCSDGTLYSTCSATKPKYCSDGTLINECSTCGCPSGQSCNSITGTMLVGSVLTATDYTVRLDSVIMGDTNVYYAVFTATNPSGLTETSSQLTNGQSYSFFSNAIRVSAIVVGYNQTLVKGFAYANVSSVGLCFLPLPAPLPITPPAYTAKSYSYEERILLTNSYNTLFAQYDESANAVYTGHGLYLSAPYSYGALEFRIHFATPLPVGKGVSYAEYPIINMLGRSVSINTSSAQNGSLYISYLGTRYLLTDSTSFPFDDGWTVKHIDVSGTPSTGIGYLNYIALKYGSVTSPPIYSGTVQTGLAQGVVIDGPKTIETTPKYQMKLKGFGSTSSIIDTTTVSVSAVGSSGTGASTHLLRPIWAARDGNTQTLDATLPEYVVIPSSNSQASLNTNARWMVVNDKVVYLKSVDSTGTGTQYNVKFAIGSSTGQEVIVGPFANASGATATFTYSSSINPINCIVKLGSSISVNPNNVTLFGSGDMGGVDSTTGKCDIYPDLVPVGNSSKMPSGSGTPYMDLRSIQGKSTAPNIAKVYIESVWKNWPVMRIVGVNNYESATIIFDSEPGTDGLTGLKVFQNIAPIVTTDYISYNTTTSNCIWINQARSLIYEDALYDVTPYSMVIDASVKNSATFSIPEANSPVLIEFFKSPYTYPIQMTPSVGTCHYKTVSTQTFTITKDTFTNVLYGFVTEVMTNISS